MTSSSWSKSSYMGSELKLSSSNSSESLKVSCLFKGGFLEATEENLLDLVFLDYLKDFTVFSVFRPDLP